MNIKVIDELLKDNIGDITFEEAYAKSKRILNITVHTSRKNEIPHLLNYLTAPNVVSSAWCKKADIALYVNRHTSISLYGRLPALQYLSLAYTIQSTF